MGSGHSSDGRGKSGVDRSKRTNKQDALGGVQLDLSGDDDTTAGEMNDLRLVFSNIAGGQRLLELRSVLKLPEVKAQIAEGDLSVEDLESVWLEACTIKGAASPRKSGVSWGVRTGLCFDGFVHFLKLCEGRVSVPKDMEVSVLDSKSGRNLVAARHRMIGLVRATLTLHQRGGIEGQGDNSGEEKTMAVGEKLHAAMVRAALEEGLAHHTPETLRELMRTGVYKASAEDAKMERQRREAFLDFHLSKQASHDDLVSSGILVEKTPEQMASERAATADQVKRTLEKRPTMDELVQRRIAPELSNQQRDVERAFLEHKLKHDLEHRPDLDELQHKGIAIDMDPDDVRGERERAAAQVQRCLESRPTVEDVQESQILHDPAVHARALNAAKAAMEGLLDRSISSRDADIDSQESQHSSRPTLDELKAHGIYRSTSQVDADARQYTLTQALLQQELDGRANLLELQDKGIYRSKEADAQHTLERSMIADQLSQSLRDRPYVEDLMDRGVLEASALQNAFEHLERKGPVATPYQVLQWPIAAAALEEGVVKLETLEEAFARAIGSTEGARKEKGMTYSEFDSLLSGVSTTQVEDEPLSLKLWALMRMRPAIDEQERHESNQRRNAILAAELEEGLGKREPLERLANKGIYIDRTPAEAGVERPHLTHALAHGLKHRSRLEQLAQKGVYLEGVESGELEASHRDTRNALEGMLSLRPELSTLEEQGYLEADELEEAFLQLVLDHRHAEATAVAPATPPPLQSTSNSDMLHLPAERLAEWPPVRAMVESGAAVEDDVSSALQKAKEATSGGVRAGEGQGDGVVDFLGFLEFVHNLDLEVDGLEHNVGERDPEAAARHALRLEKRRERAALAAKEQTTTYGTLKEHLLAHLRSRPGKNDPETQRIAKEFHPAEAVELEKNLVRNQLEGHLRSLAAGDPENSAGRVAGNAARIKELEFQLNKRMLMHRLAKRSTGEELLQKGIIHGQSAAQETLQRLLASDVVKRSLVSRPSPKEIEESGLYMGDGDHLKAQKEAAAATVAKTLEARPPREEIVARGIVGQDNVFVDRVMSPPLTLSPRGVGKAKAAATEERDRLEESGVLKESDMVAHWDMAFKSELINDRLEHRASLDQLKNKGVYQETTPDEQSVERLKVAANLEDALGNPQRPTKEELLEQGIYLDTTPQELQMSHYLAARNVKHGLEHRETVEDLKNHGIYLPENSDRAAHEKLLVKALLRRKLSHTYDPEVLEQLKQKGIYREAEHDKLEAERAMLTGQLARLVSSRPDPDQLEREHPGLLQAGTLALVFEERVMPRPRGGDGTAEDEHEGGPEHVVSFEALMTWPDVQEHVSKRVAEEAEAEMAQHFRLCDADGDGYITFSQFLRWVELCDLNPEDHLQVFDSELEFEYLLIAGVEGTGVSLEQACLCRLVQRWATSAALDREELEVMWGRGDMKGGNKSLKSFKAFCRKCEARSSEAHRIRLHDAQIRANIAEAEAKESLRSKLAAKLSSRPDLEELKKARIYRTGGLDPATELLERDLIANDLKQQLLTRPALEELEKRGIKPKPSQRARLAKNSSKLAEALDSTMQHDDAKWRSDPSKLGAGPRAEVSALLQRSLAKRTSKQLLSNKGIYIVDTDASYALLVQQVLQTHFSFKASSAELANKL